jgi:hypothetical protein
MVSEKGLSKTCIEVTYKNAVLSRISGYRKIWIKASRQGMGRLNGNKFYSTLFYDTCNKSIKMM